MKRWMNGGTENLLGGEIFPTVITLHAPTLHWEERRVRACQTLAARISVVVSTAAS